MVISPLRLQTAPDLRYLRALVLDGVYHTGEDGAPAFIEAAAPSQAQLRTLLDKLIKRILKLLTRLGHLIEEDGITYLTRSESTDPHDVMAPLQAAVSARRRACGISASAGFLSTRIALNHLLR